MGAKACNQRLLDDHIKMAVREKWRVLLLGDLVNNGISAGSKHVGLEFQDAMDPMSQVERAVDALLPIADQTELIVGGNHAYRSVKACGLHPEKIIAMMLSIARDGSKPESIMPSIIQRVQEVGYLAPGAKMGGRSYIRYERAHAALMAEIGKVRPGTEENWGVPFHPGLGFKKIDGVAIVAHHGVHAKSRDNWNRLERAARGFRLYFTGHNHRLSWEPGAEDIQGQEIDADFYSCGTYQGYEEYASLALYPRTPTGSLLVHYNKDTDRTHFERLY
jgi:hypothetical protein